MLTPGMAPLRLGVVGAGAMADYHVRKFSAIEGVRVVAVSDHSDAKARDFAFDHGLSRSYSDPADMAESGSVDAVSIAAFDGFHMEPALAALDRGLPVFCEKPMARRLREAAAMAEAASESGIPAMINFSKRNGGLLLTVRRMIDGGDIGAPEAAEFGYHQSWLLQDSWGDWRRSPRWLWRLSEGLSTFGALGDLGSHLFDAALLTLGPLIPRSCSARRLEPSSEPSVGLPGGPAFDEFSAIASAGAAGAAGAAGVAGAAEVSISGSYRLEGALDSFTLTVRGEKGSLEINYDRSRSDLLFADGSGAVEIVEAEPVLSSYERFVAVARGRADPVRDRGLDFAVGLEVQALIETAAAMCPAESEQPR